MSCDFTTNMFLSVVRVSATMSLYVESKIPKSSESFSLVLRASPEINIVLSTGERLEDIDIHFKLSTKWRTAQEVDRELNVDDVGFLSHIEGEHGVPFIHGGALLLNPVVVASLLSMGTIGKVSLVLPTVPFNDKIDEPYVWGGNRPNMLRISRVEVTALHAEGADSDG